MMGSVLSTLGQLIRIWASGHLEKTHRLATGGPYAHTRNPLYVGSVLMALGLLVAAGHPISVTAGLAYLVVFYPLIIREEAKFLRGKFPSEYSTGRNTCRSSFRACPQEARENRSFKRRV